MRNGILFLDDGTVEAAARRNATNGSSKNDSSSSLLCRGVRGAAILWSVLNNIMCPSSRQFDLSGSERRRIIFALCILHECHRTRVPNHVASIYVLIPVQNIAEIFANLYFTLYSAAFCMQLYSALE
jgi:hypothetical protein